MFKLLVLALYSLGIVFVFGSQVGCEFIMCFVIYKLIN